MSLFDSTISQDAALKEDDNQESFVKKLVESKGDNWSNPEVIAKGKLEADALIVQQKEQIAELTTKLSEQDYSKKLLDQLQSKVAEPQQPVVTQQEDPSKEDTTLEVGKIEDLVKQSLDKHEKEKIEASNVAVVEKAMREKFGDKAEAIVQAKAQEMGVSVAFLGSIASQSSEAFLRLVGTETKTESGHTSQNNVNTGTGFSSSNERNYAFYENLRKTDSVKYWSKEVQDEMLQDRLRLGARWK